MRQANIIRVIHKVVDRVRARDRVRVARLVHARAGIPHARAAKRGEGLGGRVVDVVAVPEAARVFGVVVARLEGVEQVEPVADFVDGGYAQVVGGQATWKRARVADDAVEEEVARGYVVGEGTVPNILV
jgi:hypothetical protein